MAGPRSQARRYAVLALYQWQMAGTSPAEIQGHFLEDSDWMEAIADTLENPRARGKKKKKPKAPDWALFQQLLNGVPEQCKKLDAQLASVLDRPLAQITPVDLTVLRLALYELLNSPSIHSRVILNEAIELAKEFGSTEESYRYVNGVLNKIARHLRPAELGNPP